MQISNKKITRSVVIAHFLDDNTSWLTIFCVCVGTISVSLESISIYSLTAGIWVFKHRGFIVSRILYSVTGFLHIRHIGLILFHSK